MSLWSKLALCGGGWCMVLKNSCPSCYVLVVTLYQPLWTWLEGTSLLIPDVPFVKVLNPQQTISWLAVLLHLIKAGIPGDAIQFYMSLFLDSNSIYLKHLNFMLIFQAILLYSSSPPNTIPANLPNDSICLFESTVSTNTQQHLAARAWKEDQHSSLQYDLQSSELTVKLISIEIICLGHFMPETVAQVAIYCYIMLKI